MIKPSKKFAAAKLAKAILEEIWSSEKLQTVINTNAFPELEQMADTMLAAQKMTKRAGL